MAQPNANPFSGQGDKLRPVEDTDIALVAQSAAGVGAGYITVNIPALDISTTTTNDIKTKGLGNLFSVDYGSGGLVGDGTVGNPLRIDNEWVRENFANAKFTNISQIGNIRDSNLPISGSYYSIGYPTDSMNRNMAYFDDLVEPTYIVPVTNGSEIRYAVGRPNKHSDNIYEPPLPAGEITYDNYYIDNILSRTGKWILAWLRKKDAAYQDISQDKLLIIDTDNSPDTAGHNVKFMELADFLWDSEEYVSSTLATAGRALYRTISKSGAFICQYGSTLYIVRPDVANTPYLINPTADEINISIMRLGLSGGKYVRSTTYTGSQWFTEYGGGNNYYSVNSPDINTAGLVPRFVSEVGSADDVYTPMDISIGAGTTLTVATIPQSATNTSSGLSYSILNSGNTFYLRVLLSMFISQEPTVPGKVNARFINIVIDYRIDFVNRKLIYTPNGLGDFLYTSSTDNGLTYTEPYVTESYYPARTAYVGKKKIRFQISTVRSSIQETSWDVTNPLSWAGVGFQPTQTDNVVYNTFAPSPTVIETGGLVVPLSSSNVLSGNYIGFWSTNKPDFGWLLVRGTDVPNQTHYGMNTSGVVSAFTGYSLGLERSTESFVQNVAGDRSIAYTLKNVNTLKAYSTSANFNFKTKEQLLGTNVFTRKVHSITGGSDVETTLVVNTLLTWLNSRYPNAVKYCGRILPYEATVGYRMYIEISVINPAGGDLSETIVLDTTCVKSGNTYTLDPITSNDWRVIVSVTSGATTKATTSSNPLSVYTDSDRSTVFSSTVGVVTNDANFTYQNRVSRRVFGATNGWFISNPTGTILFVYDKNLGFCTTSKVWLDIAYTLKQLTLTEGNGDEVLTVTFDSQNYILATPYTTGMYMVKVTADIPLFFNTKNDVIKPVDIDLENLFVNVQNKVFYMYLNSTINGTELEVTVTERAERLDSTLIATITTDDTKIVSIKAAPFIRVDRYRISTTPVGSAIPVSAGNPGETNFTLWE